MNSEHRLTATKYIWVALFFAMLVINGNVLFFGQSPAIGNVILGVVLILGATGSTVTIWTSQPSYSSEGETSDSKLKRGERVKRLIDLMDEDELYALRERLAEDYASSSDDYVMLGTDGELHRQHKSG